MRLAEVDGKALLRRHGLAVPRGVLLGDSLPQICETWPGFLLKAQLLEGGRGKRGLVRSAATIDEIPEARRLILATLDNADTPLLIEEALAIEAEIFVAVRADGTAQRLELLIAPQGGEDVERSGKILRIALGDDAATRPEAIFGMIASSFPTDLAARLARYAARLPEIARQEDLELLEINPLVLTRDGRLVACDAKIVRDDAADFRHGAGEFSISRRLAERGLTPLERAARDKGFQLVELEGDIVLVTSGAGLAMMMMDLLADHGLSAACFMDNLRGAPDETMTERLQIARALATRPAIKAIMFQTVIASRSLAERIEALTDWIAAEPLPKPLYVGLAAGHAATGKMTVETAVEKLRALGVAAFADPVAMVKVLARSVGAV